jgi:hypothetical protein
LAPDAEERGWVFVIVGIDKASVYPMPYTNTASAE